MLPVYQKVLQSSPPRGSNHYLHNEFSFDLVGMRDPADFKLHKYIKSIAAITTKKNPSSRLILMLSMCCKSQFRGIYFRIFDHLHFIQRRHYDSLITQLSQQLFQLRDVYLKSRSSYLFVSELEKEEATPTLILMIWNLISSVRSLFGIGSDDCCHTVRYSRTQQGNTFVDAVVLDVILQTQDLLTKAANLRWPLLKSVPLFPSTFPTFLL